MIKISQFKKNKISKIFREFENTGNTYDITDVDLSLSNFMWRTPLQLFQDFTSSQYSIQESGGKVNFVINDETILNEMEALQISYSYDFIPSKYEPEFDIDVDLLNTKYNELVESHYKLWEHIRTTSFTADNLDLQIILPQLDNNEVWVRTETGWRGFNVQDLENDLKQFYAEFDNLKQITFDEIRAVGNEAMQNIISTKEGYLAELQALVDAGIIDITTLGDNILSEIAAEKLEVDEDLAEIREAIVKINETLNSDNLDLDTLQEVVTYIQENREKLDNLQISHINGLTEYLTGIDELILALTNDKANKLEVEAALDTKQDKLTAGDRISIDENNVISSIGKTEIAIQVPLPSNQQEDVVLYINPDNVDEIDVVVRGELNEVAYSGNYDDLNNIPTDLVTTGILTAQLTTKQNILTAGENITITGNVISSSSDGRVLSVNGREGVVVLNKADVGLGNVDNTSDLDKPISTATQAAIDAKQSPLIAGEFITITDNVISAEKIKEIAIQKETPTDPNIYVQIDPLATVEYEILTTQDIDPLATIEYVDTQLALKVDATTYDASMVTLGSLIETKANISDLSLVATTGNYSDLLGLPTIPSIDGLATEEQVNAKQDLLSSEQLQNIANVTNKANTSDLSLVATSGNYNDLLNKPTIPSITGLASEDYVLQGLATKQDLLSGNQIEDINSIPSKANSSDLSEVATTGEYGDLLNLPVLFDGNYNSLENTPIIPTIDHLFAKGDININVEDASKIVSIVENVIGFKLDPVNIYVENVGTKVPEYVYLSKNPSIQGLFRPIVTTESIILDDEVWRTYSVKENYDSVEELQGQLVKVKENETFLTMSDTFEELVELPDNYKEYKYITLELLFPSKKAKQTKTYNINFMNNNIVYESFYFGANNEDFTQTMQLKIENNKILGSINTFLPESDGIGQVWLGK